ncbi:substrate-binding domain-containing protein, partial [Clostridioides difficile]
MKKLMKHLALLISFIMIFSLVGCSNNGSKGKEGEKKIAVLLPGSTGYFVATKQGIDAKSKELGVSVEYADAQWDASKQLSQAEDFMAKGVDMIALCGVDSAV